MMTQLMEGAITQPDQKTVIKRRPILEALWAIKNKDKPKDQNEEY